MSQTVMDKLNINSPYEVPEKHRHDDRGNPLKRWRVGTLESWSECVDAGMQELTVDS
jgi:hypothetical protein